MRKRGRKREKERKKERKKEQVDSEKEDKIVVKAPQLRSIEMSACTRITKATAVTFCIEIDSNFFFYFNNLLLNSLIISYYQISVCCIY